MERLTPEMRAKLSRLIQLGQEHARAIARDEPSFFADGRYAEMCRLRTEAFAAMGPSPVLIFDEWDEIIATAVATSGNNLRGESD